MHQVQKKKRRALRHGRALMLAAAVMLLLACGAAYALLSQPSMVDLWEIDSTQEGGTLYEYEAGDVQRIAVTLRSGEGWAALHQEDGSMVLEGDDGFSVEPETADALLAAASVVAYSEIVTDDPAEYTDRLAEFGLDSPRATVEIAYADGVRCVLRIGDPCELENNSFYYMTVDGDQRLFGLDRGTAMDLIQQRGALYDVTQPTLHKARIDRITFARGAGGEVWAQWTLRGDIGGDAIDRWMLTTPALYPADGESMDNLLDNLVNIRLGAYVGKATEENLKEYGFDDPRLILTLHQAEGSIGTTDAEGVVSAMDWPEDEFTLVVGGARNESVDYVRVEDKIYVTSHYSLQVFMETEPASTVSRYTAPVALGNLTRLTVTTDGATDEYVLTRQEQVAENNELVTDEDGNVVYDIHCTRNGEEISYAAFEAAYNNLLLVTVSGQLPSGWKAQEAPHTVFTFEGGGTSHTVELTRFDALHDAVVIDGYAMFYLIQGGMDFSVGS